MKTTHVLHNHRLCRKDDCYEEVLISVCHGRFKTGYLNLYVNDFVLLALFINLVHPFELTAEVIPFSVIENFSAYKKL